MCGSNFLFRKRQREERVGNAGKVLYKLRRFNSGEIWHSDEKSLGYSE